MLISIFLALCQGLLSGGALVALFSMLNLIPKLALMTDDDRILPLYAAVTVSGAVVFSLFSLWMPPGFSLPLLAAILSGLIGLFVGMLAAALSELLLVFPVFMSRLGIIKGVWALLIAAALGKTAASLLSLIIR